MLTSCEAITNLPFLELQDITRIIKKLNIPFAPFGLVVLTYLCFTRLHRSKFVQITIEM